MAAPQPAPPALRALRVDWTRLRRSPRLRARMQRWARTHPVLADITDPDQLVHQAAHRMLHDRSCPVLDALLAEVHAGDELALQVTVTAMLDRWSALTDRLNWHRRVTRDEMAAMVVAHGTEMILTPPVANATTPNDIRLWRNTRRRVIRELAAIDDHIRAEQTTEPEVLDRHPAPPPTASTGELEELATWIRDQARLSPDVAHLLVTSRGLGIPLVDLVDVYDASPQALFHRRQRAESQLAATLS